MGLMLTASFFVLAVVAGLGAGQQCSANLPTQCYFTEAGTIYPKNDNQNKYFAIGGLFNIHTSENREDGEICGKEISGLNMLNMLAFYWSVNEFSDSILASKGVTAAAVAFDNCYQPAQTVENVLSFYQCKVQVQNIDKDNVVAYVGPYGNIDSARVGTLASELSMTLVSPSANSLGGEIMYEDQKTLLRMRPDYKFDLMAINAFLKTRDSKFTLVIHSKRWPRTFSEMSSLLGTGCTHMSLILEPDASDAEITAVAEKLKEYELAKYVVSLTSMHVTTELMKKTTTNRNLIYVLHSMLVNPSVALHPNSIVLEEVHPADDNVDWNRFKTFIHNVRMNSTRYANLGRTDVRNPWLQAFQDQKIELPEIDDFPSMTAMNAYRTVLAVKMIIQGLDSGIQSECGTGNDYQFCDKLRNEKGHLDLLYRAISGNKFKNGHVKDEDIHFNYFLYTGASAEYIKIGTFEIENGAPVAKITEDLDDQAKYPDAFAESFCPQEVQCCRPTTQPPPTSGAPTDPPEPPTQTPDPDIIQISYPRDKEITGAFWDMPRPDDDYGTRFDIDQKWIIALGVLAGFGILCVLVFEIYILFKMVGNQDRDVRENKWRTMWLGQLLLLGIFLSYLTCFAYIFIPTKATCGITRFGVGVSYAICFAVLLVKLMVILTSKSKEVLLPGEGESPNYLRGVYQFLMFAFAVGIQVVINVQWLITVPPEAIQVTSHAGSKVWVCNHYTWKTADGMLEMEHFVRSNFENFLLSLVYIMVLILIITILSLNAHGIITNHRESVFIGIAAGFSIPIWLAWGLVGGLNKDKDYGHEYGDACVAFGLMLNATLILFAMFLPKVRQLVNMGVEGIYLEDDKDTIYGGSVIMAPSSFKSKGGPNSVIYVNNQGIYSEPVLVGNGDPNSTHLKHPLSTYSAPPTYLKKTESTYGGSRVLRVTDDLKGRHPSNRQKKPLSEIGYASSGHPRSLRGTLPRSRSQSDLGAL